MLIFCFRCRTYFINHIIFKLKSFIFFKTCKKTEPSETTFRIFPRKINPGQNKILLILDTAQPAPDEFNVVFVVGNKVFHVEEYKLLKNDIFQIGNRPVVIFRETTQGFQRTKRFAKKCENFRSHFTKKNYAKCENFVKTMSVIAATINCSKKLVEFSALIPQYLKFYYVILIISLPLL